MMQTIIPTAPKGCVPATRSSSLFRFPALAFLLACLCFSMSSHADRGGDEIIGDILTDGEAAVEAYDPANALAAANTFSALYFNHFEALELDLGVKDSSLKNELEVLFGAVNGNAMRGVPKAQLEASWQALKAKLAAARTLYAETEQASGGGTFLKALTILLREGAEAMLVVSALAAYLRRAGAADRVWVIHAGVIAAIPLSLLTGWAVNNLLQSTGAPLAVVEGVTMLIACAVLFYVSCWMFAKREARRWEEWIARQMDAALGKGSLLALSGAACLAVYREGAETVLFYHALALQAPGQEAFLYAGLGVAALLLVAFFFLMRHAALHLPFRLFFGVTSALLYGLAVIFLGQAIVELQAAGWIAGIYLSGFPHINWLGIAPTAQGLGAQAAMLSLPLLWWLFVRKRGRENNEQALAN
ncbi:MAG: FTR1 family iron permease [Zoogloeaceae bacterium]|jgi:high-affinity iron transporter|nr:FTR1 family iron permease [Zoogloeaceae bacterium]